MNKKKVRREPARIGTPEEQRTKKETIMHYNAVLMEDLDSKFRLVLERVDALDAKFDKKIDDLECKSERRFLTLESAIRGLKDDMIDMEHRLSSKINRITARCENHECRLNALEASQ